MRILVDADACPVKELIEKTAREFSISVTMYIDRNHILNSDYSTIVTVDQGTDSVDFALMQHTQKGDLVVTQDYGVAAMALGKGAMAIHPSGRIYTNENIDLMLFERHLSKKQRKYGRYHHNKKRTSEDDLHFEAAFRECLDHHPKL